MMRIKLFFYLTLLPVVYTYAQSNEKNSYTVLPTDSKNVYDVCFTAGGSMLAVPDGNQIKLYNPRESKLLGTLSDGHSVEITALDIAADSTYLASACREHTLVIWDLKSRGILQKIQLSTRINSVKISRDNHFIGVACADQTVSLYNLKNGELLHTVKDHTTDALCITFSSDGNLMATSGADGLVYLYTLNNQTLIATLSGHKSWVREVQFSRSSEKLYSCGDDSNVMIWDLRNLDRIKMIDSQKIWGGWLMSLDVHADGKTFVSASMDGKVKIKTPFGSFHFKNKSSIMKIRFKPAEHPYMKLAIATRGNGVLLVDARKMKMKK